MGYMKITPADTLFFRGGKPFNAGLDSWTDGSFLPTPSVIWGALFSVLFSEGKINRSKPKEEAKKLKIQNIFIYNEKKQILLIPAPVDIFIDETGNFYLPEYKDVDFVSNYPFKIIPIVYKNNLKQMKNAFIEFSSLFKHYAFGYRKNLQLYDFKEVFVPDYKVGIKRNRVTLTSEENYLYRIDLTQFKEEWSFLIEYQLEDIDFPEKGVLKLGGEGKTAKYETIDKPLALNTAEKLKKEMIRQLKNENFVKIVLKTPAYFKEGWKPDFKIITAVVGKPLFIGGFDMVERKPKSMKKYVPAGSVFILKKDEFNNNLNLKNQKTLSQNEEFFKGFGLFEELLI